MHRSFLLITGMVVRGGICTIYGMDLKRDVPYIDFSDLDTIM